jgi:hypothetical protein
MSVDTPRPRREGAVFTVEEARRYEAVALEFTTQCAYFLNMMNVANPEVELPVPGDLEDPAMRVTYVGELFEYATRFDNEAKSVRGRILAGERASAPPVSAPPAQTPARRKFPLPGKFEGGIGDAAVTFLTQCQNYLRAEGRGWQSNYKV